MENSQREKIVQAINNIYCSFDWTQSPEGYEYWKTVTDNLEAKTKNICPTCNQEIKQV